MFEQLNERVSNFNFRELLEKQCGDLADCLQKTTSELVNKIEKDMKDFEGTVDKSKEAFRKELGKLIISPA